MVESTLDDGKAHEGFTSVVIGDVEHRRAFVQLSASQVLALAATPVQVIAAPPAGKAIRVLSWRVHLSVGATAYDDAAADGNLILLYSGGATIDTVEADGLIDAAVDTQGLSQAPAELIAADTAIDATAIEVSNDGAEFTTGDGTVEVEVFYQIVDTTPA